MPEVVQAGKLPRWFRPQKNLIAGPAAKVKVAKEMAPVDVPEVVAISQERINPIAQESFHRREKLPLRAESYGSGTASTEGKRDEKLRLRPPRTDAVGIRLKTARVCSSDQRVYRQLPPNLPTDSENVQLLAEKSDWREFIDLLKRCLRSNKSTGKAMNRSFTTLAHLVDYAHRNNVNASVQMMRVCHRTVSMIHKYDRHPGHDLIPNGTENMTFTFDNQLCQIVRERGPIHDNHIYRGRNFAGQHVKVSVSVSMVEPSTG
ncbi:hypothetical protein pipiens_003129 [Culex pipiens pipiens]|uniref:Uncharacterized protein n=1 Tax=Culex pipiens pipiens TaxID=38569 RepID=A0ABD1D2W6_CULPP